MRASDNWTWTFDNLYKYENGEEIVYRVEETINNASYLSEADGMNVTNTYHPYGDLIVSKTVLNTTPVTSADYNSVQTLVSGKINDFLGCKFICIAKRDEGGLPNDGTNDIGFIYHKRAVGFALGQEVQTEMSWVAERGAWLVGGDFSAGAVVIDDDGIAAVQSVD